jgi:CSLREA domain-containing protein
VGGLRPREQLIAAKPIVSLAALGLCAAALLPAGAGATSIPVNSTADNKTDDGLCTLREAVDAANTNAVVNPGGGNDCPAGDAVSDTINLPAGTYTPTGTGDDTNGSGDLDLIGGGLVSIVGAVPVDGAPVVFIDMNVADRAFDIRPSADQSQVILRNLEVDDGSVDGGVNGGAARVLDPDGQLIAEGVRFVAITQGVTAERSPSSVVTPARS